MASTCTGVSHKFVGMRMIKEKLHMDFKLVCSRINQTSNSAFQEPSEVSIGELVTKCLFSVTLPAARSHLPIPLQHAFIPIFRLHPWKPRFHSSVLSQIMKSAGGRCATLPLQPTHDRAEASAATIRGPRSAPPWISPQGPLLTVQGELRNAEASSLPEALGQIFQVRPCFCYSFQREE